MTEQSERQPRKGLPFGFLGRQRAVLRDAAARLDGRSCRSASSRPFRWLRSRSPLVAQILALLAFTDAPAVAAPPEAAEHLVAVVATRASPHQPFGEDVAQGARQAAAAINADGGVGGRRLKVAIWHEDCSRERARVVATEVVARQPVLVIGHLCAGAALTAAAIYRAAGLLFIAPGVRHPGLTAPAVAHPLLFRLAGRDDRFAAELVGVIGRRFAGRSAAMVVDRTAQAKGMAKELAAALDDAQIPLVLRENIESNEKSYAKEAARIRAKDAGIVIMPAQPIELGVVVSSLRAGGVAAPVIGSEILAVPAIAATAREQGDRLILMLPWTGAESTPAASVRGAALPSASTLPVVDVGADATASSADGLEEIRRSQREGVAIRAFAALEVWAAAASRAGTTAAVAVATEMRASTAPTRVGRLGFDAAGDALVRSYLPYAWQRDALRPLP